MTDTADLALRLSDSNGAYLVGYRYSDVYSVLSRMLCYRGLQCQSACTWKRPAANQVIWDEQTSLDLKHRGGSLQEKILSAYVRTLQLLLSEPIQALAVLLFHRLQVVTTWRYWLNLGHLIVLLFCR